MDTTVPSKHDPLAQNREQVRNFADRLAAAVAGLDSERARIRARFDAAVEKLQQLGRDGGGDLHPARLEGAQADAIREITALGDDIGALWKADQAADVLSRLAERRPEPEIEVPGAAVPAGTTAAAEVGRRLKVLCVGTGRDGTLSIFDMFHSLFADDGNGKTAMHEYAARNFYQDFCDWRETGDAGYLAKLRALIADCPFNCVVGNGYATVLEEFARAYDGRIVLVHIRRRDRAACIQSLMRDCQMSPDAYLYYSDEPQACNKRIAAFHFGEMSRAEWNALTMEQKFGWYYDKTHQLIDAAKPLFDAYHEIDTETIDAEETRRLIARLAVGHDGILPTPTRLNTFRFDIADFPADRQVKMRWLLGRLNLYKLATDDVYGLEYFVEKFVAWTGYQVDGAIRDISPDDRRTASQLEAALDRALQGMQQRLSELRHLRANIEQYGPKM